MVRIFHPFFQIQIQIQIQKKTLFIPAGQFISYDLFGNEKTKIMLLFCPHFI